MDYRKHFIVKPGSKVHLRRIDPGDTGSARIARKGTARDSPARRAHGPAAIPALCRRGPIAAGGAAGLDAGGKDGVVRRLFSGMNPQGTTSVCFKQPSKSEAAHDFLWRAHHESARQGCGGDLQPVALRGRAHGFSKSYAVASSASVAQLRECTCPISLRTDWNWPARITADQTSAGVAPLRVTTQYSALRGSVSAKCEQSRQSKSIGFRLIMHQCSINAPNRIGEDETYFRGPGCSLFRCENHHMGGGA